MTTIWRYLKWVQPKQGDIRELSDIARPDIGVITNIGPSHLEGFGSLETVRDTKYEILDL